MPASRLPHTSWPLAQQFIVVTRALEGLALPECREGSLELLTRVALAETWDPRLKLWAANAVARA
jgi:hypothetical protein